LFLGFSTPRPARMETLVLTICLSYLFLVEVVSAAPESVVNTRWHLLSTSRTREAAIEFFHNLHSRTKNGGFGWKEMVEVTVLCGAIPGIWYLQKYFKKGWRQDSVAPSWKSNTKLTSTVSVNEDDSTGKYLNRLRYQSAALLTGRRCRVHRSRTAEEAF
jgi:hypothetical protein